MDKAIQSEPTRDERGFFLPGRAPKSPGAPKLSDGQKRARRAIKKALEPLQGTLLEQFHQLIGQAVPRLQSILADPSTPARDILACLEFVSQYTLPKPTSKSEITQTVSVSNINPENLSTAEISIMLALDAKLQSK